MSRVLAFVRQHKTVLGFIGVLVAIILFTAQLQNNPPGFYLDESSVSYNAYSISQSGRDEHGVAWPLFFRAFGDYKNPVYVYLLAAIFKITGPGLLVARMFSAVGGLLTVYLLGLIARRITGKFAVGILVSLNALLTPWLFETSRLVMEVAIFPLALILFLFYLHRVSSKDEWNWFEVASLAVTLGLVTYTYSIGRLLAPLLAFGLILFASRAGWPSVLKTWGAYLITLIPLFVFNGRQPGALMARFQAITYLKPETTYWQIVFEFLQHYLGHLNVWRLLLFGQPNPDILVSGHMLVGTFVFALVGGFVVLRLHWREPWWRFIMYGVLVSIVPASLTNEYFHLLRLIAVPIFLIVLSVPGIAWLIKLARRNRSGRIAFVVLLALTLVQAGLFQFQFHATAKSPKRMHQFDADYARVILPRAVAASSRQIHLADAHVPGYIHAYWYGTLLGIEVSRFVVVPEWEPFPRNEIVISTEDHCRHCMVLARSEPYAVYTATGPARLSTPLPSEAFRAELSLPSPPSRLRSASKENIYVKVKNLSNVTWLAPERSFGRYHVSLGNHWFDGQGQMIAADDGRSVLPNDLMPGQEIELPLTVNTPRATGDYILEIDMLQESVAWFGAKGSATIKLAIRIE